MKQKDQKGIAHLGLIAGLIVTIAVISFGAYRVSQNSSDEQSQIENEDSSETIDAIEVKEAEEEKADPVEVPKEEKELASAPVEKKEEPVETAEKKKDKTYVQMTKVSAVQDGSVVKVVSKLPSAYSGTCNYKLYQEGYERMYSSNQINASDTCSGQIDISGAKTYEGWELHVWFDSSDGKVSGWQTEEAFPLTDPS